MFKNALRDIALIRMQRQLLTTPAATPVEVVRHLGAVQAQDYYGSLWGIAQRTENPSQTAVEQAISKRQIVRSWPMRGTLHFVAAEDLRWMLQLLTPRILQQHAARLKRDVDLDSKSIAEARKIVTRELEGGRQLTRPQLYQALEHAGVYAGGSRGIHIFWWLAQEGVICLGSHAGRQPTVVLVDDWLPAAHGPEGEEALAELARRYFASHGPATIKDFTWWSGLVAAESKKAWELIKTELEPLEVEGNQYWFVDPGAVKPKRVIKSKAVSRVDILPAYDEFTVGYADRSPVTNWSKHPISGGATIFNPVVVQDGQVIGAWKRIDGKEAIRVDVQMFPEAPKLNRGARELALRRYSKYWRLPVEWDLVPEGVIRRTAR